MRGCLRLKKIPWMKYSHSLTKVDTLLSPEGSLPWQEESSTRLIGTFSLIHLPPPHSYARALVCEGKNSIVTDSGDTIRINTILVSDHQEPSKANSFTIKIHSHLLISPDNLILFLLSRVTAD